MAFFGYDENAKNASAWMKNIEPELEKIGVNKFSFRSLDEHSYIIKNVPIVGKVNKGSVIRLALEGVKPEKNDYYVYSDGDGQIPFSHITNLCLQLISQSYSAVLSCRKGESGISEARNKIEKFELFLLSQMYGYSLPDGQCGLWGFDKDTCDKLNLTADGFEIELDFLTELLEKKLKFGFVDVNISKSEKTTVESENDKKKLLFLCGKLGIGKELIFSLLNKFEEINGALPKKYREDILSLSDKEIQLKYPPCFTGSCKGCQHSYSK